eukprot:TRINITY_DN4135_c0_g1_i3.p1 TRINITY_DN4135_c0_g1~~TRINITY_DN4135_c0_g1_i3.p1  ORF type:complete len:313 (-),score=148.22 TRINITY_DN4135_c0_g1_i3:50-988(-)
MSELNLQQKQLRRSAFLVYDQAHQEESLPEEEVFLFYWPPEISLDHRHFIQGGTAAALSIISDLSPENNNPNPNASSLNNNNNGNNNNQNNNGSSGQSSNNNGLIVEEEEIKSSPIIFLKLQNNKCAVKQEGEFVFVLTGEIIESDSSLKSSLELIYQSFRFYNKNTQFLLERNKDKPRKELIKDFTKAMEELLPLIIDSTSKFSSQSSLPSQNQKDLLNSSTGSLSFASNGPKLSVKTIPFLELPPKTNRYFIKASQILSSLSSYSPSLDGLSPSLNAPSLYQSANSLSFSSSDLNNSSAATSTSPRKKKY